MERAVGKRTDLIRDVKLAKKYAFPVRRSRRDAVTFVAAHSHGTRAEKGGSWR